MYETVIVNIDNGIGETYIEIGCTYLGYFLSRVTGAPNDSKASCERVEIHTYLLETIRSLER